MGETLKAVDGLWDEKLSYSSYNMYANCPRKYLHTKVVKTEVDKDADVDTFHFRLGKAFHKLLEDSLHDLSRINMDILNAVTEEFGLSEDDGAHLLAMVRNYCRVRKKSGLTVTHAEIEIVTPIFRGFVDCILKEDDGDGWWIGDLKTGSSYDKFLNARLPSDWQLNLYAYHVDELAALTGFKAKDFKGCRYMLTVKSKLKRKAGDSFKDYMMRMDAAITSYEIPVLASELNPKETYSAFKMAHLGISSLYKMKRKMAETNAPCNFNACSSYFKPCEFWSNCHGGKTFTDSLERDVLTSDLEA